jgi:hypothetical protein
MDYFKRQSLHSRLIGDTSVTLTADGEVLIEPSGRKVTIDGDLVVTGNASGSEVTDILYVTQDGNDLNDGKSLGPDGAKATIKSAVASSSPGTTILVGPGDFYESNPITLPDFVTIRGTGDLRNTRIFPRNNTQTIFYMGNGCYLHELTMRGLRYPGWCAEIREGALVTTSPYIQNCTNMNGPWLNDGTEFIPFETVQIPGIEPGAKPLMVEDYPALPSGKQVNDTGGGGGLYVDGNQYDPASLVFSFVADAFTQIAQGGVGFWIDNFGYTQIVSCFSVFCSVGFKTTRGGYLSISNSVSDFGLKGIEADGFYPQAYTTARPQQDYFSTVASVTINTPGANYTSAPTVVIEGPSKVGGVTATATASIDTTSGKLAAVTIQQAGSGYTSVPLISFSGGGATAQATGTINLASNVTVTLNSLRDKPQTGSIIKFEGDPLYYYITGTNQINPPFVYDEVVCRRDLRRIIDAVTADIVLGTSYQSQAAATSYLRATSSKVLSDQLAPTVFGIESARDGMKAETTNLAMEEQIDYLFNIITSTINEGDSSVQPDNQNDIANTLNDLNTIDPARIAAKNNVLENREFIVEEVAAYVNDQFTELSYNQADYTSDMTTLINGIQMFAALESNQQIIRLAQEYEVRTRFKPMLLSSFRFLSEKFEALAEVQASTIALTNVKEGFNQFMNIIDDGDSSANVIVFPEHAGVDSNRADAKDQLQANKNFLTTEFTTFLAAEAPGFSFDVDNYKLDFERIIDAMTFDVLYNGNSSTVLEARYYFDNGADGTLFSDLTPNDRNAIVQSYARMRFVIGRVARGLAVTATTGNGVSQDFTSNNATQSEADFLDTLLFNIEDMIDNVTLDRLPSTLTYPTYGDEPALQVDAANIIEARRNGFITDAISYNLANNPTLTYNQDKCKRDIGYLVDGINRDILLGTNHNSIQAATAYKRANVAYLNSEQKPATILSLKYAKTLGIAAVTTNDLIRDDVSAKWDIILDIIEFDQLPSVGIEYPDPGPASNELIYGVDQVLANKAFLQEETVQFINNQYFVYNSAKCERDTGLIIDAAAYDTLLGTNYNAVTAGLSYQRANSAYVLSDQNTETIGGINFAKSRSSDATTHSPSQSDVEAAFDEVIDIIQNGAVSTPQAADPLTFTDPSTASTAEINTKSQLQNNRNFIAAETVAYINENYVNFTYDSSKCERDIGLILDAISKDVALGTNYNTVTAGLAYSRATAATNKAAQGLQTLESFKFARKETIEKGLSDTGEARALASWNEVIDIFENGVVSTDTAADAITFTTPVGASQDLEDAKDQLQANRDFIAAEIVAYVNDNTPPAGYNQTKCNRDVKYIVDGLSHDILYGGNSATRLVAASYFEGAVAQLPVNQLTPTTNAYTHLKDTVIPAIITNTPLTPTTGNTETQNTTNGAATAPESAALELLVDIIIDHINGYDNVNPLGDEVLPSVTWSTSELQQDYSTIVAQKSSIQSLTTQFIADTFTGFNFNSTKCDRDTKYIVDALTYDILYGGNSATLNAARSYWVGTQTQVEGQKAETATALEYTATILNKIIQDQAVDYTWQSSEAQDTTAGAGTTTEAATAANLLQIIQDVITDGLDNLPTEVKPDYATFANADVIAGVNNLLTEKDTIVADTITYINTTYNGFSYDQEVCKRDTGYIIDAIVHDAFYEANISTLIATRAYFLGSTQYLPNEQVAPTVAAYNHLQSVIDDTIQGVAVIPQSGNSLSQVLSGNYGNAAVGTTFTNLIGILKTAITNQTLIGTPAEIEPNYTWINQATRDAAESFFVQKSYYETETIKYIEQNILGFSYNIDKCKRDTGYIIDAAIYDMMYGGDKQSRRAALAYYNGAILTGITGDYGDQTGITAYANKYLASIVNKVSKNETVTKSFGNPATQLLTIPDGSTLLETGELPGAELELLIARVADAIEAKTMGDWFEREHNLTLGNSIFLQERNAILDAEDDIVDNAISSLNLVYGGIFDINVFPGVISVTTDKLADLNNVSTVSTSGHAFEYVGAGITYNALPFFGGTAIPETEIVESNQGKIFAGGTVDQIGNFRVGNFFAVNALTGGISLNANEIDLEGLTSVGPFIRNGIPVGVELKEVSDNEALLSSLGTQDFQTAPTQRAVSNYVEARYLNKTTGGDIVGDVSMTGDLAVNGDAITSTNTSFEFLNTGVQSIDMLAAATTINIGAATGTVTINPDVTIEGVLTVNGNLVFDGDVNISIPDETLQAYSITEGTEDYISINTREGEEAITFGEQPSVIIANQTISTSKDTGALVVDGGVGVEGSVFINTDLTVTANANLGADRTTSEHTVSGKIDIDIPDDSINNFRIHENISEYVNIYTTDGDEQILLGSTPKLIILNNTNATDNTTGAVQVTGGISAQQNIHSGIDVVADRDLIADRNAKINGSNITTDSTSFDVINTVATTVNAFGDATTLNIGGATGTMTIGNEVVIIDSVAGLQIPVGTTSDRPTNVTGRIRFNTSLNAFEGYDGIAWNTLGGVIDVDQDTKIVAEDNPGADNDELDFFTGGVLRATLSSTSFDIAATNTLSIANVTESESTTTGALTVAGGVGISKNLHVNGYINGNTNGILTIGNLGSDKIIIKGETIETPDTIKLIANAPDSAADDIVYPMTFAHHTISGAIVAGSGTGIKFELETTNDNFEIGGQIEIVSQDITGSQEDFDMVFRTMDAGSTGVEKLRLSETTSTFSTNVQVDQNLFVTGILDAAGFRGSIFADDSTEMLDAINNKITVTDIAAGTLSLTTDLEVIHGGTGVSTLTEDGIMYGAGTGTVQVTAAAGTADASETFQVLTVTSDSDATPIWSDTIDGGSF